MPDLQIVLYNPLLLNKKTQAHTKLLGTKLQLSHHFPDICHSVTQVFVYRLRGIAAYALSLIMIYAFR